MRALSLITRRGARLFKTEYFKLSSVFKQLASRGLWHSSI